MITFHNDIICFKKNLQVEIIVDFHAVVRNSSETSCIFQPVAPVRNLTVHTLHVTRVRDPNQEVNVNTAVLRFYQFDFDVCARALM